MATTFKTAFESIYLTAHLPEEVSFETDAARLEVNIFVDGTKVFKSVYYPFNGIVLVRDIRSIVEASMIEQQLMMASMGIEVYEPDELNAAISVSGIKVVFSKFRMVMGSESFLSSYFLTTRHSALIPRNGQVKLCNYTKAYAQGSNTALIYYSHQKVPGVIFTYKANLGKMQSTSEKIVVAELSHQYFKAMVDKAKSTNCKVHGVEYQIGVRRFNIFFTDEVPTEEFSFLNAFNIIETDYLYNTTTIKTEVDRSETVCGNRTQFYDESVKVKHEVETAPLTYDEAMWLNQMLTSKLVQKPVSNNAAAEILISDISSEVSDSDKELIRLKFSWRYADNNEYI